MPSNRAGLSMGDPVNAHGLAATSMTLDLVSELATH
jgi:hypothetical protein